MANRPLYNIQAGFSGARRRTLGSLALSRTKAARQLADSLLFYVTTVDLYDAVVITDSQSATASATVAECTEILVANDFAHVLTGIISTIPRCAIVTANVITTASANVITRQKAESCG